MQPRPSYRFRCHQKSLAQRKLRVVRSSAIISSLGFVPSWAYLSPSVFAIRNPSKSAVSDTFPPRLNWVCRAFNPFRIGGLIPRCKLTLAYCYAALPIPTVRDRCPFISCLTMRISNGGLRTYQGWALDLLLLLCVSCYWYVYYDIFM